MSTNKADQNKEASTQKIYQIKIQGLVDQRWSDWFNGMEMTFENDITLLTGAVPDQPKLRGILSKVWDMNLQLISVNQIKAEECDACLKTGGE